jgi:hypothetical protein
VKVLSEIRTGVFQWRSPTGKHPSPKLSESSVPQGEGELRDDDSELNGNIELKNLIDYSLQLSKHSDESLTVSTTRAYGMLRTNIALTAAILAVTRWWLDTHSDPGHLVCAAPTRLIYVSVFVALYLAIKGAVHGLLAVSSRPVIAFTPDFTTFAKAVVESKHAARHEALKFLDNARRYHEFNDYYRSVRTEHANLALSVSLLQFVVTALAAGLMLLGH